MVQSVSNKSENHFIAVSRQEHSEYTSTAVTIDNPESEMYNVVVYDVGEDKLPKVWPAGSQLASRSRGNTQQQGA